MNQHALYWKHATSPIAVTDPAFYAVTFRSGGRLLDPLTVKSSESAVISLRSPSNRRLNRESRRGAEGIFCLSWDPCAQLPTAACRPADPS